tara:strand:+ start:1137 stop:1346 length:210 start_codon:yes stop_codon:yes gene_type:complete
MKAFPTHRAEGMDLRDYFAAKAVQSLWVLGPTQFIKRAKKEKKTPEELVAEIAYALADNMMKARETNNE